MLVSLFPRGYTLKLSQLHLRQFPSTNFLKETTLLNLTGKGSFGLLST